MNTVRLSLDEAYLQLAKNLWRESMPEMQLSCHSMRSVDAKQIVSSLTEDTTSVWFRVRKVVESHRNVLSSRESEYSLDRIEKCLNLKECEWLSREMLE